MNLCEALDWCRTNDATIQFYKDQASGKSLTAVGLQGGSVVAKGYETIEEAVNRLAAGTGPDDVPAALIGQEVERKE